MPYPYTTQKATLLLRNADSNANARAMWCQNKTYKKKITTRLTLLWFPKILYFCRIINCNPISGRDNLCIFFLSWFIWWLLLWSSRTPSMFTVRVATFLFAFRFPFSILKVLLPAFRPPVVLFHTVCPAILLSVITPSPPAEKMVIWETSVTGLGWMLARFVMVALTFSTPLPPLSSPSK